MGVVPTAADGRTTAIVEPTSDRFPERRVAPRLHREPLVGVDGRGVVVGGDRDHPGAVVAGLEYAAATTLDQNAIDQLFEGVDLDAVLLNSPPGVGPLAP